MKKNKSQNGTPVPFAIYTMGWLSMAFALLSLMPLTSNAQDSLSKSLSVAGFSEHIGLPFANQRDSPLHPGISFAYERSKQRPGTYQFSHTFHLGYFYHQNFTQAFFLAWKPKFEWRFKNLVNLHLIPGIGYGHSFPTQTTYVLEGGEYVKKANAGKPHLVPSLGLGTGIHFDKFIHLPLELFCRYEAFALAPYSPGGTVPFTPNTMLSLGISYQFNH